MDRVLRYLLSNSNIAGSAAALLVIGLYLAGIIGTAWGWLALGAYVGAALPFAFIGTPAHMPEGLSTEDALSWLKSSAMPKLPPNAKAVLADILNRVADLMPRLKEMETQGMIEASSRAMLKQTITKLLPDAVENYLRLPATYAKTKTFEGGKSAQDLLQEQLELLQTHVHGLEENLLSSDVNSMLANGKFLQEKFKPGLLSQ
ncbi:hypothetical protein BH11PSE11_BH11PSE11_14840 [soil metagenome]